MDAGTPKRIARALRREDIDGVLALNATSGLLVLEAARLAGADDVAIGAFDLAPDVLQAVKAGDILFAVDQQAYLQGYLPIVLLTQRARYGVFPGQGDVLPTGPGFVTREDVDRVIELSRQSIR
jgi:simple sugar transport system substrate-binding protein